MAVLLHDDFVGPAGPLEGRVAPTGQTWHDTNDALRLDGSGRAIRNPALENIGNTSGSYAAVSLDEMPTDMTADISFTGESPIINNNGSCVLIWAAEATRGGTPPAQGIYVNGLHAIFGRWQASIAVWENNASSGNLVTYTYPTPLALDGTNYRIGIFRDGQRLAMLMPDGVVKWAGEERIATYAGPHLIYQTYNVNAPDLRPRLEEVWASNDGLPLEMRGYTGGRELPY